jgi:hypothetical protein
LIPYEDHWNLMALSAEFFFQLDQGFVKRRIFDVEGLNLQRRIHRLKSRKVTMKDPPAGLTIFGIEKIDLNGRRGLSNTVRWERKENENGKGQQQLSHGYSLLSGHPWKRLIVLSAFPVG